MTDTPIDRKKFFIGLALLLVAVAAFFGLSFTAREETADGNGAVAQVEQKKAIEDVCASSHTFLGLKKLVFDQAGALRTMERVNFDILAAGAVVRMEAPLVQSRDEALDRTRCSGRFILEIPPGAETAFNGERRLAADVIYEVQSAADGSGPVYRMTGAETIVSRLAAFDMQGKQLQAPVPEMLEDPFAAENEAFPIPTTPEAPSPPAETEAPQPVASNPSFDCRFARTRGEILVCGSDRLAAQDRSMASLYGAAVEDADRRTRRRLASTRDAFLSYRDRCQDQACVAQAYEGRMREIRDIMAQAE